MNQSSPSAPPCDAIAFQQPFYPTGNYPQTQSVHYWIKLEVKYPWHAKMLQRTSQEFNQLSSDVTQEVLKLFNL
jgi:hypothetical protein